MQKRPLNDFLFISPLNYGPSLSHNGLKKQDWRRGGFDIVRRMKEPAITWDAGYQRVQSLAEPLSCRSCNLRSKEEERGDTTEVWKTLSEGCFNYRLLDRLPQLLSIPGRGAITLTDEWGEKWKERESTVCSAWKWKWNKQFGRLAESTGSGSYRNRLDGEHRGVQVSISFYFRRESEPGTPIEIYVCLKTDLFTNTEGEMRCDIQLKSRLHLQG